MLFSSYPVEALLRPPVEGSVCLVSWLCAAIVALAPATLMMTPSVAYATAGALVVYGAAWGWRALVVVRYQRNLRRRRRWVVGAEDVPKREDALFLGRGFEWTARHTQRFADTQKARYARWAAPRRPGKVGDDGSDVGGDAALHGVEMRERDVWLPMGERNGHMLVLGTTRVGKTRALEVMASQDIRRGDTVVVFDPKGDPDLLRTVYGMCRAAKRESQFRMFHLGYPDISARYNGVGDFRRVTEVATRIANQVEGEGQSAVFRQFVWRFVNIVARAVTAVGERPDYRTIHRHVLNIDELFVSYARELFGGVEGLADRVKDMERRAENQAGNRERRFEGHSYAAEAWERVLEDPDRAVEADEVLEGLRSAMRYERAYFDKLVASLLPLLEKMTSGKVAELLAPDYRGVEGGPTGDPRPTWDWAQVVTQRLVVYIGLDALSDAPVAQAVGNSMFADLVGYAGERYKHGDGYGYVDGGGAAPGRVVVHMDEFSELMGDEFVPMVNKSGGAGVNITAYSQTLADIEAAIGDKAKAAQVLGNFNTLLMFRVRGLDTAQLVAEQLPTVGVTDITHIAGYTDSSDPDSEQSFTSRQEDRVSSQQVALLDAYALTRLPKGECFALLRGGRLVKLRLPLPAPSGRSADEAFEDVARRMQERYAAAGELSSMAWRPEEEPLPGPA